MMKPTAREIRFQKALEEIREAADQVTIARTRLDYARQVHKIEYSALHMAVNHLDDTKDHLITLQKLLVEIIEKKLEIYE